MENKNQNTQNDTNLDAEFETLRAQEIESLGDDYIEEETEDYVEDEVTNDENVEDEAQTSENETDEEEDTSGEKTSKETTESNEEKAKKVETKEKDEKELTQRQRNFLEAQKRIEAKKNKEKEIEIAKQEGYAQATKDYLKGVNPYTNKPIKDDADLNVYKVMKSLDEAGKDPIADYADYVAEQERNRIREQQQEVEQQQKITQDINDFTEKYPDVNISDLLNDAQFNLFADGKIGNKPLEKIYNDYLKFTGFYNSKVENEATSKATKKLARMQSSMGTMENDGSKQPKSFKDMSDEEFEKEIKRLFG